MFVKSNLLLAWATRRRLEVARQLLMGSHCGGREHLHKGGSVLGGAGFPT
ncbi:hypothetical protein [Nostoc sp.]